MVAYPARAKVEADGTLSVKVTTKLPPGEVDVVVVAAEMEAKRDDLGWPEGYFERTFGACADDPLTRPDQGWYEEREELK